MMFKDRIQRLFFSFAVTGFFLAIILIVIPIRYETNDDQNIWFSFAGYMTLEPTAYDSLFSTVGMGFVISRLYMIIPSVPWYTVTHLFMLWVSASIICFCIYDNRRSGKKSFWISSMGVMCFLMSVYLFSTVFLQFTTTPAMAIGAATVLVLNYRKSSKRNFVFTLFTALLLTTFAYSMRPQTFFLGIPLFVCIAGVCFIRRKEARKHIAAMVVLPLICVTGLYAVNYAAYRTPEFKGFTEYCSKRVAFMDYPRPIAEEADEVYTKAGLSYSEYKLIDEWYFFFDKVNADLFETSKQNTVEYYNNNPPSESGELFPKLKTFFEPVFSQNLLYHGYCIAFVILYAVVIFAMSEKKRRLTRLQFGFTQRFYMFFKRNGDKIIAVGIIAFFCLTYLVFTYIGRFPSRVFRAIMFISVPSLLLLAVNTVQRFKFDALSRFQDYALRVVIFALVLSNLSFFSTIYATANNSAHPGQGVAVDMLEYSMEYAISNPENIYLTDMCLLMISDPFYVASKNSHPVNFIPALGSSVFSPPCVDVLRQYGFDRVSQDIMLDERVYFLTFSLRPSLVDYYGEVYPDYEFVLVDNV